MKWIVGMDLRPQSQGALTFANWLREHSRAPGGETLVGIHVVEEEDVRVLFARHPPVELARAAHVRAQAMLQDAGLASSLDEVRVLVGFSADKSLEAARVYHRADAFIIGRAARREGGELVRLGRVARRLLRSLPAPVLVLPPDLSASDLGSGPIVALTDLTETSSDACRFAADMAARLDRPLVLLHVVAFPEDYGAHYLPAEALAAARQEHAETAAADLKRFAHERGLFACERIVAHGPVASQVLEFSRTRGALMLVCGSRQLGAFERMLLTSLGSELSASASCTVALVPPGWEPPA